MGRIHVELLSKPGALNQAWSLWQAPSHESGAEASFLGRVRADAIGGQGVEAMRLEHYPGMTEAAMEALVVQAQQRFELERIALWHRVGEVALGEVIVALFVASGHRKASFQALSFVMDRLKEDVPLWKQVRVGGQWQWVEAKASDRKAAEAWC